SNRDRGRGQGARGRHGEAGCLDRARAKRRGRSLVCGAAQIAMFDFFIERPVFSTVIALVMIAVGALAVVNLPIAQYPQVVPPQVTVTTSFPGANADVVSQSVAASIEQQVNGSQDMLYMSSKS